MDVLSGNHHFSSSPLLTPYIASPLYCSGLLFCSIVCATSQRVIWGLVYLLTLCYPLWQDKALNQNMNQLSLSMLFSGHWFHSKIFSVKETAPWLTLWCKLLFWGRPMFHETFVSITYMWRCVFGCYRKYICHRRSWPKHLRNICPGTSCRNPNLLEPRFSPLSLAIAFLQPLWSSLSKHTCSMLDPNTKCNSDISQFSHLSPVNRVSHFPTELGNHFDLRFRSKNVPKNLA